jgi:hypothetical protein
MPIATIEHKMMGSIIQPPLFIISNTLFPNKVIQGSQDHRATLETNNK